MYAYKDSHAILTKIKSYSLKLINLSLFASLCASPHLSALPALDQVVNGDVAIATDGNTMHINTIGAGGGIYLWSNEEVKFLGKAYSRGRSTDEYGAIGGYIEITSPGKVKFYDIAHVDVSAANGKNGQVMIGGK